MATSPSAIVSRQLATKFHHAAPELMTWAQERQFFQLQVQRCTDSNKSVQAGVANNVERTIESLRDAALTCAAMGLSMNPIAQLVYFIPRRERTFNEELDKSKAEYEAKVPWIITATPSYRGLAYICTRYAGADDVAAEIVFGVEIEWQKDPRNAPAAPRFEYRGPLELPVHIPVLDKGQRRYEDAVGVYCAIRWPGGRGRCEYIDAPTVERIRLLSDRQFALMWDPKKLWTEGWKKAAVRRAAKLGMQGNPRLEAAENALVTTEGRLIEGERLDVPRGTMPETPPAAGAKPRGMSGLKTQIDAANVKTGLAEEAERTAETAIGGAQEATTAAATPKPAEPPPEAPRKGSIAWWLAKLDATKTRHELHTLRDEAIAAGVDTGPDAAAFAQGYTLRSRQIRQATNNPGGLT